jgi:hypothetical protein
MEKYSAKAKPREDPKIIFAPRLLKKVLLPEALDPVKRAEFLKAKLFETLAYL